ncbi:MAG: phosphoglycerate kinase [Alphaproteobacteria bacterium]
MSEFRTLDDVDLRGRRVLVRVDLNVPMAAGRVTDDTRIRAIVPTVTAIVEGGGRAILLAHFGRPKGTVKPEFSLAPVAPVVAQVLARPVVFAPDCIGVAAADAVAAMQDGDVVLLENTRFHAGEETNEPGFAAALAEQGDMFVGDAFSTAHRAHASTVGIANHLPAFAGRAMQRELEALSAALAAPRHPVVAVVGGAKVSTKIDVLEHLVEKVDTLVIGGGMANTFLLAAGTGIGRSLAEPDLTDNAKRIMRAAMASDCRIVLPVDAVVAAALEAGVATQVVAIGEVPDDQMILDVGPATVTAIGDEIDQAATVVWNGPLGAFEVPPFDAATVAAAQRAASRTRTGDVLSVAGGGDTVAALRHAGVADDFSFVSTAGGAFLEWLEGRALPGVEILRS